MSYSISIYGDEVREEIRSDAGGDDEANLTLWKA